MPHKSVSGSTAKSNRTRVRQVSKITFGSVEAKPPAREKITAGQTIDQVTTLLGQPTRIVDVGAKKVYIYPDFKIIFVDGK